MPTAEQQREWRRAHPEKQSAYDKKWYGKNRAKKMRKVAAWKRNNGEQQRAYRARPETKLTLAANNRRYDARKNGYVECTAFPPPPKDNRCDICRDVATLHLDHDHSTGKFRGYLCVNCNLGLGKLGDDLASLRRAIAYLERTENAG